MWNTILTLIATILISQQGDRNFRKREYASHQLELLGKEYNIRPTLKEAVKSESDWEIRRRTTVVYQNLVQYHIDEFISGKRLVDPSGYRDWPTRSTGTYRISGTKRKFQEYEHARLYLAILTHFDNHGYIGTEDMLYYMAGQRIIDIEWSRIILDVAPVSVRDFFTEACVSRKYISSENLLYSEDFLNILESNEIKNTNQRR